MHMHAFVHTHTRLVVHMHAFVHMHTRLVVHMHLYMHAHFCTHAHEARLVMHMSCTFVYTCTRG